MMENLQTMAGQGKRTRILTLRLSESDYDAILWQKPAQMSAAAYIRALIAANPTLPEPVKIEKVRTRRRKMADLTGVDHRSKGLSIQALDGVSVYHSRAYAHQLLEDIASIHAAHGEAIALYYKKKPTGIIGRDVWDYLSRINNYRPVEIRGLGATRESAKQIIQPNPEPISHSRFDNPLFS